MIDLNAVLARMLALLDAQNAGYRLYEHQPVLTYADAELARQQTGYAGVEGKCVVCRTTAGLAVVVTLAGQRVDTGAVKRLLGTKRVSIASADELRETFGAEPGAAYPFAFAADIPIVVDPLIYAEDWVLYSAGPPTHTLQLRGADLRALFASLPNPTFDVLGERIGGISDRERWRSHAP